MSNSLSQKNPMSLSSADMAGAAPPKSKGDKADLQELRRRFSILDNERKNHFQ